MTETIKIDESQKQYERAASLHLALSYLNSRVLEQADAITSVKYSIAIRVVILSITLCITTGVVYWGGGAFLLTIVLLCGICMCASLYLLSMYLLDAHTFFPGVVSSQFIALTEYPDPTQVATCTMLIKNVVEAIDMNNGSLDKRDAYMRILQILYKFTMLWLVSVIMASCVRIFLRVFSG